MSANNDEPAYIPDGHTEVMPGVYKEIEDVEEKQGKRAAETTPIIQEIDSNKNVVRKLEPRVVTRFGGTLPFDDQSTQLQGAETVTRKNGDLNIRINMECELSHSQFKKLSKMRTSPNTIKIISGSYSGKATFDQLKYDRIADNNGVVFQDGTQNNEAWYAVQLQSKEQNEDSLLYDPSSN